MTTLDPDRTSTPTEPSAPPPTDAEAPAASVASALVATAEDELADRLREDLSAIGYTAERAPASTSPEEWPPASVVLVAPTPNGDERRHAQSLRRSPMFASVPIVWVVAAGARELGISEALYDDFVEVPYTLSGLAARLALSRRRLGQAGGEVLRRGALVLNLSTFQASIEEQPLELTYMEYQLLRFLAASPGRVHTRQAILHNVWGYDYYGGIRTVDVHVRRLRAKLDEHAGLIETVRSVGYRFLDLG